MRTTELGIEKRKERAQKLQAAQCRGMIQGSKALKSIAGMSDLTERHDRESGDEDRHDLVDKLLVRHHRFMFVVSRKSDPKRLNY